MVVRLPRSAARALVRGVLRTVLAPAVPVVVQRQVVDGLAVALPVPAGVRAVRSTLGGVPTRVLRPAGADDARAVLYLHGGGFVAGSSYSHRGLLAALAEYAGVTVYAPDYRLAPEHPHPAAGADAVACYRALLRAGHSPGAIAVAGDSAGAALALTLALTLRDAGEPLPAVLALLSPWLDLALTGESVTSRAAADPMLRASWLTACATAYRGDTPATAAAVSPLHAELAGLPPLVVQYGSDEILAADAERLVVRARAAGLPVACREFPGMWHDFQLFAGLLADADAALRDLAAALLVRLD